MSKHSFTDDNTISYPICDGVELSVAPSDDSRKVNIHVGDYNVGVFFEPNKKQLQRLIRNLKQIENSLKG
jgi:hypothetical protein